MQFFSIFSYNIENKHILMNMFINVVDKFVFPNSTIRDGCISLLPLILSDNSVRFTERSQ